MPPRGEGIPMRQGVGNNHEGGAGSDGTGSFGNFAGEIGKVAAKGVLVGVTSAGAKALREGVKTAVETFRDEKNNGNPSKKSFKEALEAGVNTTKEEFFNELPKRTAEGIIMAGANRILEVINGS